MWKRENERERERKERRERERERERERNTRTHKHTHTHTLPALFRKSRGGMDRPAGLPGLQPAEQSGHGGQLVFEGPDGGLPAAAGSGERARERQREKERERATERVCERE